MIPYLALFAVVAALVAADRSVVLSTTHGFARSESPVVRHESIIVLAIVAILVAFSALRFKVGTDYSFYLSRFQRVSSLYGLDQAQNSYQEPGYVLISMALKSLSDSDYAIFWAMALLTVGTTYLAVRRCSLNPAVSLLLYVSLAFYVAAFNTVRQGAAVAVLFLGATYLGQRRLVFVLLALIAGSIHVSALIAAVLIFAAARWRPTPGSLFLVGLLTVIVALGFSSFAFLGPVLALINPRYEEYLGADGTGVGTYLVLLIHAGLTVWLYRNARPEDRAWLSISILGLVFLTVGTQSIPLIRMSAYFSIFLIILIPNALRNRAEETTVRLWLPMVCVGYFVMYLLNYGGLVPYRWILN